MSGKWNIYSPNLNGQDLPEHPTGFIRKWRRKKTPDVYLGKLCQPLWVKLHFYFLTFSFLVSYFWKMLTLLLLGGWEYSLDVVSGDSIKSQLYQEGLILTLEMSMGIVDDGVGGPPPKYGTLAYWILQAEGVWENSRSRKITLTSHTPCPFFLKQVIKTSPQSKGASLSPTTNECQEESE